MPRVKVNKNRCKGCGFCIVCCPRGKLKLDTSLNKLGFYPAAFHNKNESICSGCRFCEIVCPDICIEVIKDDKKK